MNIQVSSAFQTLQSLLLNSTSVKFQMLMGNPSEVNQPCYLCMKVNDCVNVDVLSICNFEAKANPSLGIRPI